MTEPHTPGEHEIELVSGRYLDLDDPDYRVISLDDIATPLAKECRYGGACRGWYSVAEHAVLVALKLRRLGAPLAVQFAGLHHDDAEFVCKDIQRPVKPLIGTAYRELSARMDHVITLALAQPDPDQPAALWSLEDLHDPLVKEVDVWACRFEAAHLMPSRGRNWENVWLTPGAVAIPQDAEDRIECLPWQIARNVYIDLHHNLAIETHMRTVAA